MDDEARSKSTAAGGDSPSGSREGIRDTIESIVVAFILAFVFRAFVVEAFVIPTGSMAASLYGEHTTHTCTGCGYEYAFGRSRDRTGRLTDPPAQSPCPNCGFLDGVSPEASTNAEAGDRILVLKWPFDIASERFGPRRWDPTVFKDPSDGKTNFIKRLVGCPGEVLELIDGDVYTASLTRLEKERDGPAVIAKLHQIRKLNRRRMEIQRRIDAARYVDEESNRERTAVNRELATLQREVVDALNKHLRIQRKTPDLTRAQESLWFVVYNQDYLPLPRADEVGWRADASSGASSGWDTSDRVIRFDGVNRSMEAIRLTGRPSWDFYAYDLDGNRGRSRPTDVVADRRLRCLFTPHQGDGRFRMRLTKYGHEFVAELVPGEGKVTLTMITRLPNAQSRSTLVGSKVVPMPMGKPIAVALANVDYRVSLTLDGTEVLATTDATYAPDVAWLRRQRHLPAEAGGGRSEPIAEMAAERLNLDLRHVVVERDVYYTNPALCGEYVSLDDPNRHNPFCPDTDDRGRSGWGAPVRLGDDNRIGSLGWATEGNPILLRAKEYFMLGDNSPQSKDSRLWWEVGDHLWSRGDGYQVGTVPEDQLIGRAFFVYWPSGLRLSFLRQVGLIPNVGRMRWIR